MYKILPMYKYIGRFDSLPTDYQGKPIERGSVCMCEDNVYAYTGTWELLSRDYDRIFDIKSVILKKKIMDKFGSISIEFMKEVPNDINVDSWEYEFWENTKVIIGQINEGTFFDFGEDHRIFDIDNEYTVSYGEPFYVYQYSFASIAKAVFDQLNEDKISFSDLKYVVEFYSTFMGSYSLIKFLFEAREAEEKENESDD